VFMLMLAHDQSTRDRLKHVRFTTRGRGAPRPLILDEQ
jgi:hypothetical protein